MEELKELIEQRAVARRVAIVSALHPRLGAASLLGCLGVDLLLKIASASVTSNVYRVDMRRDDVYMGQVFSGSSWDRAHLDAFFEGARSNYGYELTAMNWHLKVDNDPDWIVSTDALVFNLFDRVYPSTEDVRSDHGRGGQQEFSYGPQGENVQFWAAVQGARAFSIMKGEVRYMENGTGFRHLDYEASVVVYSVCPTSRVQYSETVSEWELMMLTEVDDYFNHFPSLSGDSL